MKRLHLEPWTASAGGKGQSREEKVMKLEASGVYHYLCAFPKDGPSNSKGYAQTL